MRTTVALLAVLLVIIVTTIEAGRRGRPRRLKLAPIGRGRKRPNRPKLRRIEFIRKDTRDDEGQDGKPLLSEIDDLKSNKAARGVRKNEHYINPELLRKLNQVKDMKDFVRIFKPKGFTLRREIIFKARSGSPKDGLTGPKAVMDTKVYYQGRQYRAQDAARVLTCAPKEVPQLLERLGVATYPRCAKVKRCGGCCPAAMECVAASKTKRQMVFFEIPNIGGVRRVTKDLVDHTSCKCDCIVKASNCAPKQTYAKDRCQCECQRAPQVCPTGKKWSKSLCDCECSVKLSCGPRRQWDEKSCECICTKQPCPFNQIRSSENCRCGHRFLEEGIEPIRRDFMKHFDDGDPDDPSSDDPSPDDLWGDF